MKTKYSQCNKCPLFSQTLVKGEGNVKDIKNVRILFITEAPTSADVEDKRPLSPNGRSGKIFRHALHESKLNTVNHFVTNLVLCSNLDQYNKSLTPPDKAFETCSPNWKKIVEVSNPEIIVALGSNVLKQMGFKESINTIEKSDNIFYQGHKVIALKHPSWIARNGGLKSEEGKKYIKAFTNIYDKYFSVDDQSKTNEEDIPDFFDQGIETSKYTNNSRININNTEPQYFKLEKWCYNDDMYLFDIQHDRNNDRMVFIFKYPDNTIKYHFHDSKEFYHYKHKEFKPITDVPFIEHISNVDIIPYRAKKDDTISPVYEGDLTLERKHAIDYRLQRIKDELESPLNILYFDIEVFNNLNRSFPDPMTAPAPVNAISFKMNDEKTHVYLARLPQMDNKPYIVPDNKIVKIFDSEKDLLYAFCQEIKNNKTMIMTAWNSPFDLFTIYNRMKKLNMDTNKLSPLDSVCLNDYKGKQEIYIYGLYVLDMLQLYKKFTIPYGKEPSYKLSAISQKHLGKDKVAYEGLLDSLYTDDLSKFIEYSGTDTDLLRELEAKLSFIDLRFELVKLTNTNWRSAETTMGMLDPMIVSFAKKKNLVCRNSLLEKKEEKFKGAYVRNPKQGLYKYVVDLDYTSLYPSIICSLNIGSNTYIGKINEDLAYTYLYNRDKFPEKINIKYNPLVKSNIDQVTTKQDFFKFMNDNNAIMAINGCIYKGHDKELSFLYELTKYIFNSRKFYKDKMKEAAKAGDNHLKKIYDNKQAVFKILNNSLYGIIGAWAFRFFEVDMAESITLTGQEISQYAAYHLDKYMEENSTEVDMDFIKQYHNKDLKNIIYGDTDSMFIGLGEWLERKHKINV